MTSCSSTSANCSISDLRNELLKSVICKLYEFLELVNEHGEKETYTSNSLHKQVLLIQQPSIEEFHV